MSNSVKSLNSVNSVNSVWCSATSISDGIFIQDDPKYETTRPGFFCAKDCLDNEEMYIYGGILSLLLVVVGCSELHCAILGCTGL